MRYNASVLATKSYAYTCCRTTAGRNRHDSNLTLPIGKLKGDSWAGEMFIYLPVGRRSRTPPTRGRGTRGKIHEAKGAVGASLPRCSSRDVRLSVVRRLRKSARDLAWAWRTNEADFARPRFPKSNPDLSLAPETARRRWNIYRLHSALECLCRFYADIIIIIIMPMPMCVCGPMPRMSYCAAAQLIYIYA
jgi:hypothetical protein